MAAIWRLWLAGVVCATVGGCYALRPPDGGGMTAFEPPRRFQPADIALPEGYRIELVAHGLTFPTAVTLEDRGGVYVTEAGYSYGEVFLTPRLLKIEPDGRTVEVARGDNNGPWTGVAWRDGAFYIAEGGELRGGRILRVELGGRTRVLVDRLPSTGDHHTNGVAFGPDGWLYFAVGTATNSGVVGPDNHDFGWLRRYPEFRDTPCRDVTLAGVNYESENPLSDLEEEPAVTGAFKPFGTPSRKGEIVPGRLPCNGAVFRVAPEGGPPELVAWGFRNPFGLAFVDGELYVTDNAYDRRGSRPVFGAGDLLWRVQRGAWHGWPDFHGQTPLDHADTYAGPGMASVRRLLAEVPNQPPRPAAVLGVHSSSDGMAVSRSASFGHVGELFVAQFGDQAPVTGKVWEPVGFRVVRVDPATGVITPFAANEGGPGPASYLDRGGLERPVSVNFAPRGEALYIVDFGVLLMSEQGSDPRPGTGALWRIVRDDTDVAVPSPETGR
jgi:glucose/arabinose dehydrogenase